MAPDEAALLADVSGGPYLIGVADNRWGLAETATRKAAITWPHVTFWIAASARPGAPDRYFLRLNCAGYPTQPPTGSFCEPDGDRVLAHARWPKGRDRVAAVFRTDWQGGSALYHPYDGVSLRQHADWPQKYPSLVWTSDHTIAHVLDEYQRLLSSDEYLGCA